MSKQPFNVTLVFHLKEGQAEEELKRSTAAHSFPNKLAKQPGCIEIKLVKIDENTTMSVQAWESQADWWAALENTKNDNSGPADERENILVSRDYLAGEVKYAIKGAADKS